MPMYTVAKARVTPELRGAWDGPAWRRVRKLSVDNFRPESSAHRPVVEAKAVHDQEAVYVVFRVQDRYVRAVHTQFQDPVCRDSCVEFFVQPKADAGYFNFELNCGGTMLLYYIVATRKEDGTYAQQTTMLPPEDGRLVRIYHSLPKIVDPEIAVDTVWTLEFAVPLALFAKYVGGLGDLAGQQWRANFYKCGDGTTHKHWAAWSPVDRLNFHLPHCFGTLAFKA